MITLTEVIIKLDEETINHAKKVLNKYGVELRDFIQRFVREFLLYDLDEVISFVEKHNYGEIPNLEKIINGFMDLMELGILTHSSLEEYILSTLDTNNYWLQDYGIDLDDFNVWILFMGAGIIDEFIIDADRDGVSLTATHSIEDLIEEDPSILEKIEKAIEQLETDLDISIEEDHIKIAIRASSLSELPKIAHLENAIAKIFEKIGIKR